jgi:hypothetical protein
MSWRDLLLIALSPTSTHAHRLGRAHTLPEQDWLTGDYIAYVLRLVAGRLDTSTLTPSQYRTERHRMLLLSRSRWLHGRLRLPTDEQIRLAAGGWDAALTLARLERPGLGDQGAGKTALSTVELLERCYAAYSTEPSALELRRFGRANRIPWTPDRDCTWLESVAAWKQGRREQKLLVPAGPPPRSERPDYSKDVGAARPGERRKQDWNRIEDCIPHVIAYLEQLAPGERSNKRGYNDWALSRPGRPAYSAFDQHGGWERVRETASERLLLARTVELADVIWPAT